MVRIQLLAAYIALSLFPHFSGAQDKVTLAVKTVAIDDGIQLNYIESGSGVPVIFIHGTLGDLYMWTSFVESFGKDYHAIAYSRRYNYPNDNSPPRDANHSTDVEASDLAQFIAKLELPRAHIVGYSYGGYTALHLAVQHPELVRTLVLAEPPLLPWLADMSENQEKGRQMLDIEKTHFIEPARNALNRDDEEEAIRIFIDYVIRDGAFEAMPEPNKNVLLRNAPEFVALVRSESMFAPLLRNRVASLSMPTLMISGEETTATLQLTDAELEKTLPRPNREIIPGATHGMWYEKPLACRNVLSAFLNAH